MLHVTRGRRQQEQPGVHPDPGVEAAERQRPGPGPQQQHPQGVAAGVSGHTQKIVRAFHVGWLKILCFFRAKLMLGNIEELRDYHKHVMLPKMETAVDNAVIMR